MTVFVLQKDSNKDFSAAKKFGKVTYVFGENRQTYPDNADRQAEHMITTADKKLQDFNPEVDYLLLNGDPVGLLVIGAIIARYMDVIRVLKWDKGYKKYYPIDINIYELR